MEETNFLDALDDWGSILTDTYDESAGINILGIEAYNEEPTLFTIDKNMSKSLIGDWSNKKGEEYFENYLSKNDNNEAIYIYFRVYTAYNNSSIEHVVLSFKVGELGSKYNIDRGDQLYTQIFFNKQANIFEFKEPPFVEATLLNHDFLKSFMERAITEMNKARKLINNQLIDDEELLARIFNTFKERTKDLS